jgi:hypothetical protein
LVSSVNMNYTRDPMSETFTDTGETEAEADTGKTEAEEDTGKTEGVPGNSSKEPPLFPLGTWAAGSRCEQCEAHPGSDMNFKLWCIGNSR